MCPPPPGPPRSSKCPGGGGPGGRGGPSIAIDLAVARRSGSVRDWSTRARRLRERGGAGHRLDRCLLERRGFRDEVAKRVRALPICPRSIGAAHRIALPPGFLQRSSQFLARASIRGPNREIKSDGCVYFSAPTEAGFLHYAPLKIEAITRVERLFRLHLVQKPRRVQAIVAVVDAERAVDDAPDLRRRSRRARPRFRPPLA